MQRLDFFFYGSLRDAAVRHTVLGPIVPPPSLLPASLAGHRVAPVEGGRYPVLVAEAGHTAEGLLVCGVDLTAAARASFFEGEGYDYGVGRCRVATSEGRTVEAWAYLPSARLRAQPGAWRIEEWERRYRSGFLAGAHKAMRQCRAADIARHRQAWQKRLGGAGWTE